MSTIDPFAIGSTLLTYRLEERVGASVWRAEDTRTGKPVAIKVLTKQLPRDAAKRDPLVREIRLGAALYHSSLIGILEIVPAGDALIMVMEWFDGQPVSTAFRNAPADRTQFFRIACQAAEAVRFLHVKNVIHGNIAGDSVLIASNGQVKVAGLNAVTFLPRREGQASAFSQKGSDPRAVSYMAPEQILSAPIVQQTDIFSLGVVLYEVATGRLPFLAPSAAEIARKIVDEQPASPKAVNPAIDAAVLAVMGKCFYKDPFRRYKDGKQFAEEITKAEPQVTAFVADLAKAALAAITPVRSVDARNSILLFADVANYEEVNLVDQAAAAKAAARMQQVLGEAIYLFDGSVVDPFGPRLIGELPSIESALEAARKGEFDFSPKQQEKGLIPVRLLLHAGDVETHDGHVEGAVVDKAFEVLSQVDPLRLYVTEDFAKRGRGNARLRDAGARAGVKLYTIQPVEVPKVEVDTAAIEAAEREAEEAAATAAAALAAAKRKRTRISIAAALVIVLGGATGFLLFRKKPETTVAPARVAKGSAALPPATASTPRKVVLQAFTVDGADPVLQQRADAIRMASLEILRTFPELRVKDTPEPDANTYMARLTGGAAAPQITPETAGKKPIDGPAVPLIDASTGIQSIVSWISTDLKLPARTAASAEAYNAFADAVAANAAKDDIKTESSLRAAIKADPNFLPVQLMAMRFFDEKGKAPDALAAAKQVVALDPTNSDAGRRVARAGLGSGDLAAAFNGYSAVLHQDRADVEALNALGRYALAANDTAKFTTALHRLDSSPTVSALHEPDMLMASGHIDDAVEKYYDVEQRVPANANLALKIGRVAVLRHSAEVAGLELKKLEQGDPNYGAHVLKAYIAAHNNQRAEADAELKLAQAASKPGDDFYTCSAEVAAISGDARGVVDALEHALARKEPTASYVLTNPLFGFLQSDARFLKVRAELAAQQNEIRSAMANVPL